LWDTADGTELAVLKGHAAAISGLNFTSDSRHLVTSAGRTWDEMPDPSPRVWDVETGALKYTLKGHSAALAMVNVTKDNRHIITGSADKTARLWDIETGLATAILEGHSATVDRVAISPDGRHLVTADQEGTTKVWDAKSGALAFTLDEKSSDSIRSLQFSPDARRIITSSNSNTRVWDAERGSMLLHLIEIGTRIQHVSASADGSRIALAMGSEVRIHDGHTGAIITTIVATRTSGRELRQIAMTSDGGRVVTVSEAGFDKMDGAVEIWDAVSGKRIARSEGIDRYSPIALTNRGARLIMGGADGVAHVWDLETGAEGAAMNGGNSPIVALAVSQNGSQLATGARDGSIRIWDLTTGVQRGALEGHTSQVEHLAFTPDGRRLVSSSNDRTVRIWEIASRFEVARHEGATGGHKMLSVTSDGAHIITATDSEVRTWALFPARQALIEDAQSASQRCLLEGDRKTHHLDLQPPAWCILQRKWPYAGDGIFGMARRLLSRDRESEGERLLALAIKRDPQAARKADEARAAALIDRGEKLVGDDQQDDALALFARALALGPEGEFKASAHGLIAFVWLERDKADIGLSDAEAAVAAAPEFVFGRLMRGLSYLALGRLDGAVADFDFVAAKGHWEASTAYGRGRILELKGDRDGAIAAYREAVSSKSSDDIDRNFLAKARERLKALGVGRDEPKL
jgi:WD40 repeat protein